MNRLNLARIAALIPTCLVAGWISDGIPQSAVIAVLIGTTAFVYRETTRRELAHRTPLIEQRVRAQAAAEIEALRDGMANPHKPYNQAFAHGLDCAIRAITKEGR